jgi:hypothetical protein
MRLALTDKTILALQFTASGRQIVRDAELPGFFVMVGKRTKTFMVQGDLRQNGKRQSLRLRLAKSVKSGPAKRGPRPRRCWD